MLNALVKEDDIRRVMDSRRCKDCTCTEDMTMVVLEKRVVVLWGLWGGEVGRI